MADTFLFTIAENVLGEIGSLALEQVCLAWGLERNKKKLEEKLLTIKAVLLDAKEKKATNRELRMWLGRLKDFLNDAEDMLDELEYERLHKQVVKEYGSTKTKVCSFFSSSNPLVFRFKIGHKIKKLRKRLDEIADEKSKFHLTEQFTYGLGGHRHREREMTDSFVRESRVIGRDADKEKLMEFLLKSDDQVAGQIISVIPIVGIGGLGKTSLAKLLYNDKRVGSHFQLKIWACVPEDEFEKKKIIVKMMKSLTDQDLSYLDTDQLQARIRDQLDGKKFLFVLDDVWMVEGIRNIWVGLKELLEVAANGSRVIVTTRNERVSEMMGTTEGYKLKGLPREDCLSLLKKWAFKEGEEERYPNLLEIGEDIVKKCGGIPLAVRTLGTLLYSRNEELYWKSVRNDEIWKLKQEEGDILPAIRLTYDQMSSQLQQCFAICSVFPKDFVFSSVLLVEFWMAHGLLQSPDGIQEPEDLGLQYIKELYSRSFFQEFEEYGYFFVFKMHDLVHDLALLVAQNECSIVNFQTKSIPDGVRHLSFSDQEVLFGEEVPCRPQNPRNVRTILFPFGGTKPTSEKSSLDACISRFRFLRLLDLNNSSFEFLPSFIGDLIHLRSFYLSYNRRLKKTSNSICKLYNLQALCLDGCIELEDLPRDIRNMISLRNLKITTKQKSLTENGIECLKSLRNLVLIGCTNLEYVFGRTVHLPALRTLYVVSCPGLVSLSHIVRNLTALESLTIDRCMQMDLMDEVKDCQNLKLRLLVLNSLPQLTILPRWLQGSWETLECLGVRFSPNFTSFPEWLHNFKSLKKIFVADCPRLLSLPDSFGCLTNLKELEIVNCPQLSERCQPEIGQDWPKIAHVPHIYLDKDIGLLASFQSET